jgi:hypothetical protein
VTPSYQLHSNRCRDTEPTRAPDEVQWIWCAYFPVFGLCTILEMWCEAWAAPRATSGTWLTMNTQSLAPDAARARSQENVPRRCEEDRTFYKFHA